MSYIKRLSALTIGIFVLIFAVTLIGLSAWGALKEAPFSNLLTLALFVSAPLGTIATFLIRNFWRRPSQTVKPEGDRTSIIQNAIADLESTDPPKRRSAIEILASVDNITTREALARAANRRDTTPDVRVGTALGLAKLSAYKDECGIDSLIEGLRDESGRFREPSRDALKAYGQLAVPQLIESLQKDEKKDVRSIAAGLLGQSKDTRGVDPLCTILRTDPDINVRRQAVWALGQIQSPDAVTCLLSTFETQQDQLVRARILYALRTTPDSRSISLLKDVLYNSSSPECERAALALGAIDDPSAEEILISYLVGVHYAGKPTTVVMACNLALEQRGTQNALEIVKQFDPFNERHRFASGYLNPP